MSAFVVLVVALLVFFTMNPNVQGEEEAPDEVTHTLTMPSYDSVQIVVESTYDDTTSNDIRDTIDNDHGDGNGEINQTELEDYFQFEPIDKTQSDSRMDDTKPTVILGGQATINVLGNVNDNKDKAIIRNTTTLMGFENVIVADEHTLILSYVENDDNGTGQSFSFSFTPPSGWIISRASGFTPDLTTSYDYTKVTAEVNADDTVNPATIVIRKEGTGEKDAPGPASVVSLMALVVTGLLARRKERGPVSVQAF